MTIYGIDASNHQGNQGSLGGVAASFYVHKLTEGTSYVDPYAAHNLSWARGLKIPVLGGYHYIRSGDGAGQADYFVDRAHALFGKELRGYVWQLDCEQDAGYADVKAFIQRWHAQTGAPILFYTGDWWLNTPSRGWDVKALGFAGLWAAPNRGYVGKANDIRASDHVAGYGGFDKLTIVQYDARPSVGDTNVFAGSLADLKALCGGTSPAPTPDRRKVSMYTSVNASGVRLKAGVPTHVQFTAAGAKGAWVAPYGKNKAQGGYNVGLDHHDHVGSIAITGNTAGAAIKSRFVEMAGSPLKLHKSWPATTIRDEEGLHTVTHWCDRHSHLWVELTADRDCAVDVAVVTTALD